MRRFVPQQLVAFGFFFLLACIVAYWPLFHTGTHIPNNTEITDYFHFNWNYWWIRHALSTRGLNLYETNFVLFPFTNNLGYHTFMPFWYPVWAVFEPFLGTLGAMQIVILLATGLTGYLAFHLLEREGVSPGLALAGGAVYQLSPAMYAAILFYTPNYLNFFWLPAQILIWGQVVRYVDRVGYGLTWGVIQGVAFYAMLMTDTQIALYSAFLLVPYGLLALLKTRTRQKRIRLVGLGVLAVELAFLLFWVVGPLRYMLAFDRAALAPPPAEEAYSIPFPQGYFSRDPNDINTISLGAVVIPMVLVTLVASNTFLRNRVADRRRWFWLLVAVIPLVLSVGASLTIVGVSIPMPYRWLHEALGGMLRSAHRFGMVFILPAMIFVGRTWTPVLKHRTFLRLSATAALLLLIFIDARLFFPMPVQPVVPHYNFYEQIGDEQGEPYDDAVVLEVPVAAGSGEIWVGESQFEVLKTQFYGIIHGKRMVNGLISRVPIDHFWYLRTDDPLLSWLGQRRFLEPELAEPELRRLIYEWPIGYIVVHQDLIGRVGSTAQEVIGYLNSLPDLLCPVWVERDAVVYRTSWHPDGCPPRTPPEVEPGVYQVDIGAIGDERYIGWGWHWPEDIAGVTLRWMGEYPETQIYIDLLPSDYEISISAQAFWEARELYLKVNGVELEPGIVHVPTDGLATYTYHAPAKVIGDGKNLTLTLNYDGWVVPDEVGQSADRRKLALAVDWIRFQASQ